jgi:acetyl esterase
MPVDPQLQLVLDMVNAQPVQEWTKERAPEFRQMFDSMVTMLGEGPEGIATEDLAIPGPAGDIPARIYRPDGVERPGICVFFHGGGFVLGNIATHDRDCRMIADQARCLVVSVDYRLAPEHPCPAAPDDCFAALQWVAEHGEELGGDTTRLAVAGDSAGGNLAAVTALRARDAGGPDLSFQLLVYPVVDMTPTVEEPRYESMLENAEGYYLTLADMEFFSDCYLPDESAKSDPSASPILADLAGLPPALVLTCEFDPLRDQGEAYAKGLADAGVPVTLNRYDGAIHGVMGMAMITEIGGRFISEAALALGAALAAP